MARIRRKRIEFQVTDPQGRTILLHTYRWVNHVITLHPEMFGHQQEVSEAIRQPNEIHRERLHGRVDLVYWKKTDTFPPMQVLKVVVYLPSADALTGDVTTAYPFRNIELRGELIWVKS